MNVAVTCQLEVSIGHRLRDYVGKCASLHGHNYLFKVTVDGDRLDKAGMVVDFKDLKSAMKEVLSLLDHAVVLRDDDPLLRWIFDADDETRLISFSENPTAENIAIWLTQQLDRRLDYSVSSVVVRETEDGWATVTGHAAQFEQIRAIEVMEENDLRHL